MKNASAVYDSDIKFIKGVGEKRAKLLNKLGIENLYDVLHFFPRKYADFSSAVKIADVKVDEVNCIHVTVCTPAEENFIRKGMTIFKLKAMDETGLINIVIFNNKYMADSLSAGGEFFIIGKVTEDYHAFQISPQTVQPFREDLFYSPVYPSTAGLNSFAIERIMKNALSIYKSENLPDPIPDEVRTRNRLCHEQYAVEAIHFPKNENDIDISRKRFIFEELFFLQCGMLAVKQRVKKQSAIPIKKRFDGEFVSSLPYTLTNAQKRVIDECLFDMGGNVPMNRLLQGDVGSGKTVVAATLMHTAVKNGRQCALMAPTEILAAQHFETLSSLMPREITISLLTGATKKREKDRIKAALVSGEIDVLVGTHAVITDDTLFSDLGLIIIDEQHRFGVRQRSALSVKGKDPHVLVMSATPIPRTLSLIIYGELDVSIIDEMPHGKKSVRTYCVDSTYEKRVYDFIKKNLDSGKQAYIVCPLVEENEENELTAAKKLFEELEKNVFSSYSVGLLHGKMKSKEKEKVMNGFADGSINLLVSTTVIEVGIDVKNATIMLIRDADRFGLSQLHQLRGRIGRGGDESHCILMTDNKSESVRDRMKLMCSTLDGFILADEDLKNRGPGEFLGSRQSGLPSLKIASFADDLETVRIAAREAQRVFRTDPKLIDPKNAALRDAVKRMFD